MRNDERTKSAPGPELAPPPVPIMLHRTSSLRISEVEACSFCEEFVGTEFRVLDVRFGIVRELLDETSIRCKGFPEAVARALAADPSAGIVIGEDDAFTVRLYMCLNCFDRPADIPTAIARTVGRRALVASRKFWNRHIPLNQSEVMDVKDPVWTIDQFVRFAHIPPGGPAHRVMAVAANGMIEIEGMTGQFAPAIFVPVEFNERDVTDAAIGDNK